MRRKNIEVATDRGQREEPQLEGRAASGSRGATIGGYGAEAADHVNPLRNCLRVQVFDRQFGLSLTIGQWSCKGPFAEVAKGTSLRALEALRLTRSASALLTPPGTVRERVFPAPSVFTSGIEYVTAC